MKTTIKTFKNKTQENRQEKFPDYPTYPPSQDIYNQNKKESDIDPEDVTKRKPTNVYDGKQNVKDFNEDKSGSDLDIPGSELDDAQENIGSEDEENNGYSIGGDNHTDLEEDNSDRQ